jgi:hypothetical protein
MGERHAPPGGEKRLMTSISEIAATVRANGTLLVIEGVGVSPYAARGLTQTYGHIDQAADLRRTVNGSLVNFGSDTFRKITSKITGSDLVAPPLVWPGQQITVSCVQPISYYNVSGATGPAEMLSQVFTAATGSEWTLGDTTFYLPVIDFIVANPAFEYGFDEWAATSTWTLNLEQA